MNKLKDELRLKMLGQLSSEKTEVDINNAYGVCKDFTVSFAEFIKDNCIETPIGWQMNGEKYTTEELFNIFIE